MGGWPEGPGSGQTQVRAAWRWCPRAELLLRLPREVPVRRQEKPLGDQETMVKEGKEKQEATSQTQATKGGRPPSLAHRPWMGLLGRPCFLSTSPLLRVKTALTCGTLQLANVLPMWFLWMHTVPKPRESAPLARGHTGGQAGVRSQDKSRRPPPAEAHLENVWKNALWMGDSPPPPRRFLPHPGDGALWIPGPWVAAGSTSLPSASINAGFAGRGSRARACGHVQGCGVHSLVPGVW